jgi:ribonuclease P/MRP protein subunit RPP40
MGHQNPAMKGQVLEETKEEKDIGVMVTSNLKPTAQCARTAKMAQTVLGQISRTFHYRDRHIFLRLYKQYVRPHLEFSTPAWAPWAEGDRNCLEKVQQRAIKMVSGLKSKIYEERLRELNLPTLLERRHQADMDMVHMDHTTWFQKAENEPRAARNTADPYNLKVKHGRLDLRRNFFGIRVIEDWNRIPANMKSAEKSENFKAAYRKMRATQMDHAAG